MLADSDILPPNHSFIGGVEVNEKTSNWRGGPDMSVIILEIITYQ